MSTPSTDDGARSRDPNAAAADYDVPPEASVAECPYCAAPLPTDDLLALHLDRTHPDEVTERERETVADAREREVERLRLFRLQALGALVLLYFGLVIAYSVFA